MNPFFYSLLISIVLINGVYNVRGDDCKSASNSTCESCLKISGCAFCKTSKECFARPSSPVSDRCPTGDLQIETCIADAKTWLIILGTVGGVVLIVVIIIICCCCRKCKQRALLQEIKRENVNEQRLEERRTAAESRSAERNEKYDEIRMKYGLSKGGDPSIEYRRMS